MRIEVFYHLYIPPNEQAINWIWWVDSQLSLVRDSHLSKFAKVNMCITLPTAWTHYFNIPFSKCTTQALCNFKELVEDYITYRYPFVNIIDVRDVNEENIYEGQTLSKLYEFAQSDTEDTFILYFHGKGTFNLLVNPIYMKAWKDILDKVLIGDWMDCVKHLFDNEVVGIWDSTSSKTEYRPVMSGNFWWTKSSYIKKLPDPLKSDQYMSNSMSHLHPGQLSYRYAFEHWINLSNPKVKSIKYFNTDSFHLQDVNPIFIEHLI